MAKPRREDFSPPPKAPVFEPTLEEFKDPLGYISKIRPAAERVGICKIRPPKDWTPPFAVDVDSFRFVPRVQKLNELEAHSRVKMNFLAALYKFWELQGTTLKIPQIEGSPLDLHELWKVVMGEGGYEEVMVSKKWSHVAKKMGYKKLQHSSFSVRQHYEKILYPYCVFRAVELSDIKDRRPTQTQGFATSAMSTHSMSRQQKRLRSAEGKSEHVILDDNNQVVTASSAVAGYTDKPAICKVCEKRGDKDRLLVCDNCLTCIHTFCLIIPLQSIPRGGWFCPTCIAAECSKQQESYGFEESQQAYSLETFGEMANRYKCEYFQIPAQPQSIKPEIVEKEFWRLVESGEDEVAVQYGADLHSSKHGSGFPFGNRVFTDEDILYAESPWNLNNLPNLEGSVLRHVSGDISGMKVPWIYVGMCFSSFCWHNEDHWSYSINYLHWGEPKTWYGVPGHCAEKFEKVMESAVPELFRDHPDLLHHLVTLVSPTLLMKNRVPVVSTHQCAGEFVVTFPRAYHAGFNQGFNLAEAVNFCPADWIPNGRGCMDHYRAMRRYTVFSHDELICRMALNMPNLDFNIANAVDSDLAILLDRETDLRDKVAKAGILQEECESFELLPDEERQCSYCQALCFLSGISCKCRPAQLACLYHSDELCECPMADKSLRYRYTLDEIRSMKARVAARAHKFVTWSREVEGLLDSEGDARPTVGDLERLLADAKDLGLSSPDLMEELQIAVEEADECAHDAQQLLDTKRIVTESGSMVTVDDLEKFIKRLDRLACRITEGEQIQKLLERIQSFQLAVQQAVVSPSPPSSLLIDLLETAKSMDVELPQITIIEQKLRQAKWLDQARQMVDVRSSEDGASLEMVEELIGNGQQHLPHTGVAEALRHLEGLVKLAKQWQDRAKILVEEKPTVSHLQSLLTEVSHLPINVPALTRLKRAFHNALQWEKEAIAVQDSEVSPELDALEVLLERAHSIPLQLEQLAQIESLVAAAQGWRDRACRAFLKKSVNTCSLLQVLYPRLDTASRLRRDCKPTPANLSSSSRAMPIDEEASVLSQLARDEVGEMRELRDLNIAKAADSLSSASRVDIPLGRHCVCSRSVSGVMLSCELCLEWFHTGCVHLPRSKLPSISSSGGGSASASGSGAANSNTTAKDDKSMASQAAQSSAPTALKDNRFLCSTCVRSRRPRLDTVLSLLVSLRKVPVQLVESAALQSLTERAMHWQELARTSLVEAAAMLERQNCSAAAALLSAIQPGSASPGLVATPSNGNATAANLSATAIISRSQPLPPGLVAAATQAAPCKSQLRSTAPLGRPSSSSHSQVLPVIKPPSAPLALSKPLSAVQVLSSQGLYSLHDLSSSTNTSTADAPSTASHPSNATAEGNLDLPANVRAHLEELMLQGDMLEVGMDEPQQLWQLLHLCCSTRESMLTVNAPVLDDPMKEDRRRKKKRKHDTDEDGPGADASPASSVATAPAAMPSPAPSSLSSNSGSQLDTSAPPPLAQSPVEQRPASADDVPRDPPQPGVLKSRRISGESGLGSSVLATEEAVCSAPVCHQANSEAVVLMQCTICRNSYHRTCIGAEMAQDTANTYVCYECAQTAQMRSGLTASTADATVAGSLSAICSDLSRSMTEASDSGYSDVLAAHNST